MIGPLFADFLNALAMLLVSDPFCSRGSLLLHCQHVWIKHHKTIVHVGNQDFMCVMFINMQAHTCVLAKHCTRRIWIQSYHA